MAEAILAFITAYGYGAVFALMVLENIFPPIPSEVILPFIGYSAAAGELNFILALLVATAGSLCGTFVWFAVGWLVPMPELERFFRRYGGYIAIEHKDFMAAVRFFTRFEVPVVFFGRLLPGVRSVISIPAGCVHMPVKLFLMLSLCGTLLWNTMLLLLGYIVLDDFALVERYMNPIADGIIYAFILLYLAQVIRFAYRKYRHGA